MRSQRDYNQQVQPGLVMPGMGPGSMPPAQPGFAPPQMAMQGGNYAPNPYPYNQMSAEFGGPGYIQGNFPPQQQMQNIGGGWASPGHRDPNNISDVMSQADADAAVDKYDNLINKLNGIDPELAEVKSDGIVVTKSVDATYHELLRVIQLLEYPEEWIPPTRARYVEAVRVGGKPIIDKLKNYSAQIAKLR